MTLSTHARVLEIVKRVEDGGRPGAEELRFLLALPHRSAPAGIVMAAAREISRSACDNRGEIYVQIGLNVSPCPRNCMFCSFAAANGVFAGGAELSVAEVVDRAVRAEVAGANAIYLMATGDLPMGRFVEVAQEVRRHLRRETPLVANVGDLSRTWARRVADSGCCAVYHAVRMGEGVDTGIEVRRRLRTFVAAHEAGLRLATCVEPVGPEHGVDELIEKIAIHRDAAPVFSGAMRRIPIPGTAMATRGQLSELRLAYLVAVVRLAMGKWVIGNCTHEPNALGASAGANLFWAEIGPNPRDVDAHTEVGRGLDVARCRTMLEEAEYEVLIGPSIVHTGANRAAESVTALA